MASECTAALGVGACALALALLLWLAACIRFRSEFKCPAWCTRRAFETPLVVALRFDLKRLAFAVKLVNTSNTRRLQITSVLYMHRNNAAAMEGQSPWTSCWPMQGLGVILDPRCAVDLLTIDIKSEMMHSCLTDDAMQKIEDRVMALSDLVWRATFRNGEHKPKQTGPLSLPRDVCQAIWTTTRVILPSTRDTDSADASPRARVDTETSQQRRRHEESPRSDTLQQLQPDLASELPLVGDQMQQPLMASPALASLATDHLVISGSNRGAPVALTRLESFENDV